MPSSHSDTPTISGLRDTIEDFVADITSPNRLGGKAEPVLDGRRDDLSSADLSQKPETYTENKLIYPILDILGIEFDRQPHGQQGGRTTWPDFGTTNLDEYTIGENKPLNNVSKGEQEIKDYLDSISIGADYGILTDGFDWIVYTAERSGDKTEFPNIRSVNLRPVILQVAREDGYIGATSLNDVDVEAELETFLNKFGRDSFNQYVTSEAPQYLRNLRKKNVEEFYELYIELLFGKSDRYDYDTHLMAEIEPPHSVPENDERTFAVTLMNRLLFIKILETKAVVPEGLLSERLDAYEQAPEASMQGFYGAQLKPLFYDLFNKPKRLRKGSRRQGWQDEIPFLNGGLFRENIDDEKYYSINPESDILTYIIRDLIEGSVIGEEEDDNGGIDPAVLGSVFEKTINYMGGEQGTQKAKGAYYTPDDVTDVIVKQTVNPQVQDTLIDVWVQESEEPDELVREYLEDLELQEITEKIESGSETALQTDDGIVRIDFDDDDIIEAAITGIRNLTVVDPSCGSGHFLTTAMEEIHRVRESLERGKNNGVSLSGVESYEAKKELALNAIFGVDVDSVAIEIARLRVWLKIIEDGWEPEYGKLPNIEINVVAGNSLIGLPIEEEGQLRADVWDDRIQDLIDLRLQYKKEEEEYGIEPGEETDPIRRQDVIDKRDEIRDRLNKEYLKRLNYNTKSDIETASEWRELTKSIDGNTLYPEIETIRIQRPDESELTDEQKERIHDAGFRPYKKSGRLEVEKTTKERKENSSSRSYADITDTLIQQVAGLLEENDFELFDVERQPLAPDLDEILGKPFHWLAEFPELIREVDGEREFGFDIVVGNPPYGNILSDSAKSLIQWMDSGTMNEVAGPFVERQLQLLEEGGHFGNIHAQTLIYKGAARPVRNVLLENLTDARMAAFGHRPATVFAGANPRASITTGKKDTVNNGDGTEESVGHFRSSELLLFYQDERDKVFGNIQYSPIEGLILGDYIGDQETNLALPKVGTEMARSVLCTLRDSQVRQFDDVITRKEKSDHVVWRSYHPLYWMNPFLEDLYTQHPSDDVSRSRDFEPMYFKDELERRAGFLILQSSMFYHYWTVYENQRDLNWGPIEAFPFPERDDLENIEEEVMELSEEMWKKMQSQFNGRGISNGAAVKPISDRVDELLGPMLDLSEEQIEWVKNYHTEYGRQMDNEQLDV